MKIYLIAELRNLGGYGDEECYVLNQKEIYNPTPYPAFKNIDDAIKVLRQDEYYEDDSDEEIKENILELDLV